MASKAVLLVLACFLLSNIKVSSESEEGIHIQGTTPVPVGSPVYKSSPPPPSPPKIPPPPAIGKAPPPPSPPVVKAPQPPSPPVIKTPPPPSPPVVKAPPSPPPPVKAYPPPPATPPVKQPRTTKECIPLCEVRCKFHSRKNVCLRACLTCCDRCKCVPPGQYGNKEKCGKCYAGMTTRGGKPKCP